MLHKGIFQEKGLLWTGIFGIVVGFICIIPFLLFGDPIPPEGKWSKVITFDLAIGFFALTTAVVLPFIGLSDQQRKRFVYPLIGSFWFAYLVETIQNIRGFDPRFSKAGQLSDRLLGLSLGLDSLIIIGCLVYLMILIFRQKNPNLIAFHLSMRYACLSIMLAFAGGIWMTILQGRVTISGVDIMILHFVGFHGYQAIPLIGWFVTQGGFSTASAKRWVHVGGSAWLLFCLLLFVQTALGYSAFQLAVPLLFASLALMVWAVTFCYTGQQVLRERRK